MKKTYLLAYSSTLGTKEQVKACLNKIPQITHWRTDLPSAFYLVSESNAKELTVLIRECRGGGRFLITEISASNKQGWITPESWHLINNQEYKRQK